MPAYLFPNDTDFLVTRTGQQSITGQKTFLAGSSGVVGIIFQGASGQTADLTQWQNSAGTPVLRVLSGGAIKMGSHITGALAVNLDIIGSTIGLAVRGAGLSRSVTNKALTGNVATLTTSVAHGFTAGRKVVVSGVDATFDGTYTIKAVPTTTTFTYDKTNADIAAVAATGTANAYSQSANLAEWQDHAGASLASVSPLGRFFSDTYYTVAGGGQSFFTSQPGQSALNIFSNTGSAAGPPVLNIRGASGQSANLQEWQTSTGTVRSFFDGGGGLRIANGAQGFDGNSWFQIAPLDGGHKAMVIRGAANQGANLLEIQNSAGTVLSRINASGIVQGVDTGWHVIGAAGEPAFQNGWRNYTGAGGYIPARFRKHADGRIEVQGLIENPTAGGSIAFFLPAGYRIGNPGGGPSTHNLIHFPASAAGGITGGNIRPDGGLIATANTAGGWFDLGATPSYLAEA